MGTGWALVPLAEVMRPSLDPHKVDASRSYPNLGIYSFGRGVFQKPPIEGTNTSASTLYRVRAGQFIYSRLFAFEGAYGLVPRECDGHYVSNEFPTFNCDPQRLDAGYVSWLFKRPTLWRDIAARSTGMGDRRQRIHPEQVLAEAIPLPPLDEQRRIVARIDALAAKIAEARGLRVEAGKEVKAGWQRCARERVVGQSNAIPRRPLRDLIMMRGGGTPSKSEPRFWGGSIPWITPKDMKCRELYDAIDHISEEATRESPAKLIAPGAVLIVVRGMILARTFPVALLQTAAAINQDMKALLPTSEVGPEYLASVLWAMNSDVLELVDRSSHDTRKLLTDKLESLAIPVPSPAEQRRIVAELDALYTKVEAVKRLQAETSAELDALLPAILDRAFKGEL